MTKIKTKFKIIQKRKFLLILKLKLINKIAKINLHKIINL